MLPTTIDGNGRVTAQQHSCCLVIDDCVAIDAGNLAMSASDVQKQKIRNIVLTHAHLDHIAGLPIFIDDLFATLKEPVLVHAMQEVIEVLEAHIFNWVIYPRFRELTNQNGEVMRYIAFEKGSEMSVAHLKIKAVEVNHKVPSVGFILSDETNKLAMSGDTAEMNIFWDALNAEKNLNALLIECAFPDGLDDIAQSSHHLTPKKLQKELEKFKHKNCPIYVINLKPMYRENIINELNDLNINNLQVLEIGKVYEF
jgi:cAMP phosphodiesterase